MTFRSHPHNSPSTIRQRLLEDLQLEGEEEEARFSRMLQNALGASRSPHGSSSALQDLNAWFHYFVDFYNQCIDDAHKHDLSLFEAKHDVDIGGVHADGTITATCGDLGNKIYTLVQCGRHGAITKCSCSAEASSGRAICEHIICVLDEITDLLEDRYSNLATRIQGKKFDSIKPDPKLFEFDQEKRIRNLLESIIPADHIRLEASDSSDLPPLEQVAAQRIAWNLVASGNTAALVPMLQAAKKRGGWAKGRKISLANLTQYTPSFSKADQRVQSLVRIETTYYRPEFNLSTVAAVWNLVGEPNVLLNGEPAEVAIAEPCLQIERDQKHMCFGIEGHHQSQSTYLFSEKYFLHIRSDINRIEICEMQHEQFRYMKSALQLPPIPIEHESEFLRAAEKLRGLLTIRMPESMCGKVVDDSYRPVLLLRARNDGSLDYGLRIRNSLGLLLKPGMGKLLLPTQRDGQALQVKRSTVRENLLCTEMARQFQLSADSLDGSLTDFEAGLQLIEKIQDCEAEERALEVLWDKQSETPIKVLGTVSAKNVSVGITQQRDWFQLSGACDFGKESLGLPDLLNGLHAADVAGMRGDYVRLGDRGWAKISQDLRRQLRRLHDAVNQERGSLKFDASSAPAIRDLLDDNQQLEVKANRAWQECLLRLEQSEKLEPVVPPGLNAQLRDYQTEGFKWLRRLAEWGVGGILADDMGLGKTLQTLAVILDRAQQGPTLVIAPTSVGFNWVRECEKFSPDLNPHLYRDTERAEFLQEVGPGSLVVCSYGLALRDAQALAGVQWATLVLDEAQAIKNSRSKTSAAIATIPANWKVALTGTPVENHLGELWSLFRVIAPGVLGGWDQFRRRFAAPIERDGDEERRLALRTRLQPFLLRRTKSQVLADLPSRTESNLCVELSPAERKMYDEVRGLSIAEVDQIAALTDVQDQRFRILALLTRLRQLACSPQLVHDSWTERSSKIQLLCETLLELRQEGHRVLVFSQFVQLLTLIRQMLDEEKITYEYLDGSTSADARQNRVDSFQNGDATVFLISLKAGGTGLNLTAADYVIHMDPWWNPAVEDQATDRAHRIGQTRPVMVYRLVSQNTIEEEILKLHETKRDLVAGIMEGAAAAGKLSTEDLMALLRK